MWQRLFRTLFPKDSTAVAQAENPVVATQAPTLPDLRAAARRQGGGWVYVIDARTPTPDDQVPPEDIIGGFEVKDGAVVPGSYQAGPKHQIFSSRGLFKLDPTLHDRLMERLTEHSPPLQPPSTEPPFET